MALPIERLTDVLAKLPGIGRRSAERIAIGLVSERSRERLHRLIDELRRVEAHVILCSRCGALTEKEQDPCLYCTSPRRDAQALCLVESPSDILLMEKAGVFRGRYHVLGGTLSPMKGESVEHLRIEPLLRRLDNEPIQEVILALNTDVESDATASYLGHLLAQRDVKVTRLAVGLPVGSGLAYSDSVTLSRALNGRLAIN